MATQDKAVIDLADGLRADLQRLADLRERKRVMQAEIDSINAQIDAVNAAIDDRRASIRSEAARL